MPKLNKHREEEGSSSILTILSSLQVADKPKSALLSYNTVTNTPDRTVSHIKIVFYPLFQ